MNNFTSSHMRSRRNLLDLNGFTPIQFPRSNYSTDAQTKSDMKCTFGEDLFLNKFHLLSDPLKKNLADSVITGETKNKNMIETKDYATKEAVKPPTTQRTDYYPSLAGITNFFAGVFNVMGTMFQKRASSPASQYYDCFDKEYDERQMAPPVFWPPANFEVQNKNEQSNTLFGSNNDSYANLDVEMNVDCRTAANQCEEKLNQLHLLISQKNNQNVQKSNKSKLSKRPRKVFIDAGSVEDNFEDAFSSESFVSLANDTFIEYCSPFNIHDELLIESDAPRMKTEFYFDESMDITPQLPEQKECKETTLNQNLNIEKQSNDDIKVTKTKDEIISSCEDKLSKLKALLQSNRCKSTPKDPPTPTDPLPIPNQNLETVFGNEISSSDLQNSNSQNSDYFNEVTGKFNSSSVDSEDSFQIVFTDSPQNFRRRIPSDCDSEDSFIVFEESPDSCYTSNEVFGDDILDNDSSDSDSDIEEDSGCNVTCKLSPNLSRTFGDLTDNSLYCQDVVDSGVRVCVPSIETEKTGLLVDEMRKIEKKKLPAKKVHFSTDPPKVHVMRVWAFAARQARAGHWERHALDRERFKRRIADVEMAISWVLKPQHRSRVMFQRFRPWWNAQKRKELTEKKEAEEREKLQRMTEKDARSNDCVESSDNCDTYIDDNVDLDKDKIKNSFDKDRNDLSQDTTVGVVGDINNYTIKETFDTSQERKVSQNSNDIELNALNTQVNNNCDMKVSEISDSLKITTINGSLETTKFNDSLKTTKINGALETTKINGSLEPTKINGALETTNKDGSLIKTKTLLKDGCIDT